MRKQFSKLLLETSKKNTNVWTLCGDVGFGVLDEIRSNFAERCINVGASEQLMLGAAVGLSNMGKIPVCYTITPFVIYRPYEWIRNYLNEEKIPVKLVGSGRDKDYGHLGFSHWAHDDEQALENFSNIKIYKPNSDIELEKIWEEFIFDPVPAYLNLKRN